MKNLILLFFLSLPALAQSNLTFALLQAALQPCRGTTGNRVLVSVSGVTQCAMLDTSTIVLDTSTSTPTLRGVGGGTGTVNFMDGEILPRTGTSELLNGINATFTLSFIPNPPASLVVLRNGVHLWAGRDFVLSGSTITFVPGAIPQRDDLLIAKGRR